MHGMQLFWVVTCQTATVGRWQDYNDGFWLGMAAVGLVG
jgi:hypothetical protein